MMDSVFPTCLAPFTMRGLCALSAFQFKRYASILRWRYKVNHLPKVCVSNPFSFVATLYIATQKISTPNPKKQASFCAYFPKKQARFCCYFPKNIRKLIFTALHPHGYLSVFRYGGWACQQYGYSGFHCEPLLLCHQETIPHYFHQIFINRRFFVKKHRFCQTLPFSISLKREKRYHSCRLAAQKINISRKFSTYRKTLNLTTFVKFVVLVYVAIYNGICYTSSILKRILWPEQIFSVMQKTVANIAHMR